MWRRAVLFVSNISVSIARGKLPVMPIINLAQYAATPEQAAAGVVEPQDKTAPWRRWSAARLI